MSEATASPAPVAPAFVADRLADFSDRLPAMLVKELRQGLRAKTFVIVFLTLQAVLALVLLGSLGATRTPQAAGHFISSIIFLFFSYAVLVIQPVRGIGALHREIQGQTIELMVLTRLTAWRIVIGKWIALVGQSALLLAAIVPYLILRYWFGDMNLFGELMLLALVFLGSVVLTAVVVGISCVPSVILRGLLPLIAAAIGIFVIPPFCFDREFEKLVDLASLPDARAFWSVLLLVIAALYVGWTTLGLGASMIAPAAENHSSIRRWIILGLLGLTTLAAVLFKVPGDGIVTFVLIITVPAVVMAITEPFALIAPICHPFVRRGPIGSLAGLFLYPGWPSGVLFSVLAIGLAAAALRFDSSLTERDLNVLLSLLGTLLMPAALLSPFARRVRQRFVLYLLLLVATIILTLVVGFVAAEMPSESRGFLRFFVWLPWIHVWMQSFGAPHFTAEGVTPSAAIVTAIYAVILLISALLQIRRIREVEQECLSLRDVKS